MKAIHTPTPWTQSGLEIAGVDGARITAVSDSLRPWMEDDANAAFIVRACNAFESMHLALVMIADTIPFQFMEPEIRKLVMDALDSARPE